MTQQYKLSGFAKDSIDYPDVSYPVNNYPGYPDYQGNPRVLVATENRHSPTAYTTNATTAEDGTGNE